MLKLAFITTRNVILISLEHKQKHATCYQTLRCYCARNKLFNWYSDSHVHCAPSILECTGKLPFPILMMQRVSVIISHIYWLMMIIKLKTKVQKTRENNTCGEGISTMKIKDIKVRWKFEARLRSRFGKV